MAHLRELGHPVEPTPQAARSELSEEEPSAEL